MKTFARYLVVCGLVFVAHAAFASSDALVTAVYSKVSNGYQRERTADGSPKREFYALAKGVYVPGLAADPSIDKVRYPQVAKLVAQFLALENYYLAENAKSADLLLTITWGTTRPFSDAAYRNNMDYFFSASNMLHLSNTGLLAPRAPGVGTVQAEARGAVASAFEGEMYKMLMFEDARRDADQRNARLLGYVDEINYRDTPARFGGAGDAYLDLWDDIESERYYVIIAAYDFREMAKSKGEKPKMLWSTRVSVRAQGNRFNETLAAMLKRAAPYFGENTGHLIRRYEPTTKVEFGDLQFVGYESKSQKDR